MQLVIKSNIKTSVTTYIHATTYIHVKPIFTQALMIWLETISTQYYGKFSRIYLNNEYFLMQNGKQSSGNDIKISIIQNQSPECTINRSSLSQMFFKIGTGLATVLKRDSNTGVFL